MSFGALTLFKPYLVSSEIRVKLSGIGRIGQAALPRFPGNTAVPWTVLLGNTHKKSAELFSVFLFRGVWRNPAVE